MLVPPGDNVSHHLCHLPLISAAALGSGQKIEDELVADWGNLSVGLNCLDLCTAPESFRHASVLLRVSSELVTKNLFLVIEGMASAVNGIWGATHLILKQTRRG